MPKLLQSVGRRYVQYFSCRYGRSGTLWEGHYRACVVNSEQYLLNCMRYIELNPVRAGITRHPGEYAWTSYHANAQDTPDLMVTPHDLYDGLGGSGAERQMAYRQLFPDRLAGEDVEAIREATNKNWALGDLQFKQRIEALSRRRAGPVRKGRSTAGRSGEAKPNL